MKYWLMKSEPDVYGIDHLAQQPKKTDHWDGIRNYQVRNMIRDEMKKGDQAFFYHSNCKEPGIVGIVKVVKEAYPDHTAFDPKSDPENPRWLMLDVQFVCKFARTISLQELKTYKSLSEMLILRRGNRLSITPVSKKHWDFIIKQANKAK